MEMQFGHFNFQLDFMRSTFWPDYSITNAKIFLSYYQIQEKMKNTSREIAFTFLGINLSANSPYQQHGTLLCADFKQNQLHGSGISGQQILEQKTSQRTLTLSLPVFLNVLFSVFCNGSSHAGTFMKQFLLSSKIPPSKSRSSGCWQSLCPILILQVKK